MRPINGKGVIQVVVYLDILFLLNMAANYLLLLGAGRMAGVVLHRWKIAAGAGIGALYAVIVFLPGQEWLGLWPVRVIIGIVLPLVAYGKERRLLKIIVLFFGGSAGLAGLIVAFEQFGKTGLTIGNKVLYSNLNLRLLILIFVICYCLMSLFFRRIGRHSAKELIKLNVILEEETIELTALLDSGHTLTDPLTNRPVVIADAALFAHIIPSDVDLHHPTEGVKCCHLAGIKTQLVFYRAVGVEHGMLLAIKAQSVTAGKQNLGSLLIALSPNPVGDGEGYQALIGGF